MNNSLLVGVKANMITCIFQKKTKKTLSWYGELVKFLTEKQAKTPFPVHDRSIKTVSKNNARELFM